MKRKNVLLFLLISIIFFGFNSKSFAQEKGKSLIINMNKMNLDTMEEIPVLQEKLSNSGYVGLMNIKGDGGSDDKRVYATIGAGTRANITSSKYIDFSTVSEGNPSIIYKNTTGKESKLINNIGINNLLNYNKAKGEYGAKLGAVGQTLIDNNLKVSVLGNADTGEEESSLNRNIALMAMDNWGRVEYGNIDDINLIDYSRPYGIKTDYKKLLMETKKLYNETDVMFIELGDTTRLDSYRMYLNEDSYKKAKKTIFKDINSYLEKVFELAEDKDTIYIMSTTPTNLDYKNKKRLSPVIKFEKDKKGLLTSPTTRREGIVGNVDIGADILSKYGLKSKDIVGKQFEYIDKDDNVSYLKNEYKKIVSINSIRSNAISVFVGIISFSWVLSMVMILFKDKVSIKIKDKIFFVLKEFIKLGLVMPLAFLLSPIFNFSNEGSIVAGILIMVTGLYLCAHKLFKNNDLKQMAFYSLFIIVAITIDSMLGTFLMKNNIMSYDAIVGARYYGIGNEYEGITVASAILGLAILVDYKKIPKWLCAILLLIVLIPSAHPAMGANVGGAISEFIAYLVFVMLLFDIKIDMKKIIFIGLGTGAILLGFSIIDIVSRTESHLSLFVNQILTNGPQAIVQTFGRKIAMNIKIAKSSIWVNILLSGIFIVSCLILKPNKHIKDIKNRYSSLFKGIIASTVGCVITLLVNDSGIVSASTALIYILVPIIIIIINLIAFNKYE